mmetsp:Transcript_41063/g.98553  ORF Transcript_41063/g.98553 Transcript_41063/m.98553 type:complete len:245 (+) Transcript_41063:652-1386(+)
MAYLLFSDCSRLMSSACFCETERKHEISTSRLRLEFSLIFNRSAICPVALVIFTRFLLRMSRSRTSSSMDLASASRSFLWSSISPSTKMVSALILSRATSTSLRCSSRPSTFLLSASLSFSIRLISSEMPAISSSLILMTLTICPLIVAWLALVATWSSSSAWSLLTFCVRPSTSLRVLSVCCFCSRTCCSSLVCSNKPVATRTCFPLISACRFSSTSLISRIDCSSRSFRRRSRSVSACFPAI